MYHRSIERPSAFRAQSQLLVATQRISLHIGWPPTGAQTGSHSLRKGQDSTERAHKANFRFLIPSIISI